jgi:RimK-like ATP-grasp domain
MILVLTAASDTHADRVIESLTQRGADVVRFDPADFPNRASVTFDAPDRSAGSVTISIHGGRTFDLDGVDRIWYRRPGQPDPGAAVYPDHGEDTQRQSAAFLDDLWSLAPGRWLPGAPSVLRRPGKLTHLRLAGALGFATPATLVTNKPDAFLAFYRSNNGQVISKLLGSSPINSADSRFARYTELVEPWELVEADAIKLCPVIFQQYVEKRVELRVTLVGDRLFAAAIDSQAAQHSRVDWRRYDRRNARISEYRLDSQTEDRCRQLMRQLGLSFAAIDLIVDRNDRVVFVELNPNGQYLWIEDATGLPISEAIADHLEGKS